MNNKTEIVKKDCLVCSVSTKSIFTIENLDYPVFICSLCAHDITKLHVKHMMDGYKKSLLYLESKENKLMTDNIFMG